ncbi:MAG TPA: glycogen/starch/alpha-glucan phosphorylase [Patescibacteria group bacterium]|nr:glycogen/starch/alpha-glucan phosphorylase [Patescibacteria group bacterium]
MEKTKANLTVDDIKNGISKHLAITQGQILETASIYEYYQAVAHAMHDIIMLRLSEGLKWIFINKDKRKMCYLSAEYLIGPQLGNNLVCFDEMDLVRQAVTELGVDFDKLLDCEEEPGLGNGGLGRLAACYIDSCATTGVPAIGYGIRYEFGIFRQEIRNGWQVEKADKWLSRGFPWETVHSSFGVEIGFGGHTQWTLNDEGQTVMEWIPQEKIRGIPCDIIIPAYGSRAVSMLRLFKAEATEAFHFSAFNSGNYYGAVNEKVLSENISKVLYPNDEQFEGKQLRLKQQYFFVSCALQDMLRLLAMQDIGVEHFAEQFAVQLNDTHPSIAVAELMRLLVDKYYLAWEQAWEITQNSFSYTNHTLLPEALECWPISLFAQLLPRHLEIIYEINTRFLHSVKSLYPHDIGKVQRLSLVDDQSKTIRMANLACVGSHTINGVAELHSELLKQTVLRDFYELYPQKFTNVTNGVTPRRFLALANQELTALISDKVGNVWIKDLYKLRDLEVFADQAEFQDQWAAIKLRNKQKLAEFIKERTGIIVDPNSMFDVQIKRIHEYKRQHLNILQVIAQYNRLKRGETAGFAPRTVIIAGKAAPGYYLAKLIIKLINSVAEVINNDPDTQSLLKVVFFPNYNVKNGNIIFPAADLSEQISTAGKEASGTGNMKLSLNGALTIGTLDGANVEIRQEVGSENFFLFGLVTEEVQQLKREGDRPKSYVDNNPLLQEVFEQLLNGTFAGGDRELYRPLVDSLLNWDEYLVLADFDAYDKCHRNIDQIYLDKKQWTRMSILNVARMGKFSSDRAIREYCRNIWKIIPQL